MVGTPSGKCLRPPSWEALSEVSCFEFDDLVLGGIGPAVCRISMSSGKLELRSNAIETTMDLNSFENVSVNPINGTVTIKSRVSDVVMKIEAVSVSRGIGFYQVLTFALGVGLSGDSFQSPSEVIERSPTVVSVHALPATAPFALPTTPRDQSESSPSYRELIPSSAVTNESSKRSVYFSSAPPDFRSLSPALQSLRVLSPTWSSEGSLSPQRKTLSPKRKPPRIPVLVKSVIQNKNSHQIHLMPIEKTKDNNTLEHNNIHEPKIQQNSVHQPYSLRTPGHSSPPKGLSFMSDEFPDNENENPYPVGTQRLSETNHMVIGNNVPDPLSKFKSPLRQNGVRHDIQHDEQNLSTNSWLSSPQQHQEPPVLAEYQKYHPFADHNRGSLLALEPRHCPEGTIVIGSPVLEQHNILEYTSINESLKNGLSTPGSALLPYSNQGAERILPVSSFNSAGRQLSPKTPSIRRHSVEGIDDLHLLVYVQNGVETLHIENTSPYTMEAEVAFKQLIGMRLEPINKTTLISEVFGKVGVYMSKVDIAGGEVKAFFRLVPMMHFSNPSCKYKIISAHTTTVCESSFLSLPMRVSSVHGTQLVASTTSIQFSKSHSTVTSISLRDSTPFRGGLALALFRSIDRQNNAMDEFVTWTGVQVTPEHHIQINIDPSYRYSIIILAEEGRLGEQLILEMTNIAESDVSNVRLPQDFDEHVVFVSKLERLIVMSSTESTTTGYIAPGSVNPCGFIISFAYLRWMALFARNSHQSLTWSVDISFTSTPLDWKGPRSVEIIIPPGREVKIATLLLNSNIAIDDAPSIEWDINWKWS